MQILNHQLKRVFRTPFFLLLLAVFLAFDLSLVFQQASGHPEDMENTQRATKLIHNVVGQTGITVNSGFQKKFDRILSSHTRDLTELYRQETGKKEEVPSAMLESLYGKFYEMPDAQKARFQDDQTLFQFQDAVQGRSAIYGAVDFPKKEEQLIREAKLTGSPAEFLRKNSRTLQKRVKEIRSDGEQDTVYFPGDLCHTHSFLYQTLFRTILFESAVLGVLIMMYAVNFEFAHGTQDLAYTSRRGRKLMVDQFCAAFLAGMAVPAVLMAVVLPVFFANFNFSNLWNASVSSPLNVESSGMNFFPVVTWSRMTVWQYLWATIGLALALQAVFCLLALAVSIFCRNNYVGFLIYAFAAMGIFVLPKYLPWSTLLPIFCSANPFTAWKDCGFWLARSEPASTFPLYFPALFLIWGTAAAVLIFFGVRHFRRADL